MHVTFGAIMVQITKLRLEVSSIQNENVEVNRLRAKSVEVQPCLSKRAPVEREISKLRGQDAVVRNESAFRGDRCVFPSEIAKPAAPSSRSLILNC